MTASAQTKEQLAGKGLQGDRGDNVGHGTTQAKSNVAENAEGELNPSAPGETGTTPGTNGKAISAND